MLSLPILAERSGCGVRMGKTGPLASQSERAIQWETRPGKNKYYLLPGRSLLGKTVSKVFLPKATALRLHTRRRAHFSQCMDKHKPVSYIVFTGQEFHIGNYCAQGLGCGPRPYAEGNEVTAFPNKDPLTTVKEC